MIETDGLTKRFGDFVALDNLTLRVGKGEVFGFLGPNGAGKTTTTKLVCTLLAPSEGTARVSGFDVVREAPEVRRRIGYLPERVPVYKPLTAREDLRYFGELHAMPSSALATRIEEVLERVGLTNVEHKRCGAFSKGMVQRLGIARAILHDPEVLFFDEPASGLDPTGRRGIRELMVGLAREGRTIFLTSHDLAEVRAVCRRVGFIRNGKLVSEQGFGDAAETRLVEIVVEGNGAGALEAVKAVPGVTRAEFDGKETIRAHGVSTLDPRDVARAAQRGGAILLMISEKEPSIESLYEAYVEKGEQPVGLGQVRGPDA